MFSLTFFQTHLLLVVNQIQLKLIAFHIIWYIIMVGWDIYTAPKTLDPEKLISRGIAIYSEDRKTKRGWWYYSVIKSNDLHPANDANIFTKRTLHFNVSMVVVKTSKLNWELILAWFDRWQIDNWFDSWHYVKYQNFI